MPNGIFKLPEFPVVFGEKELERMEELETLAKEQQRIYGGQYTPSTWARKPALERGVRRLAEKAYAPPQWFREITPWEEYGFTPEQADIYIRETEEELQELRRTQQVAERAPSIMDYIAALASAGLLTGELAQLYELIPELNPTASPLDRLNLLEEEREWFLEYAKTLAGKSPQEIYDIYTGLGFPAPKTIEELMALIEVDVPEIDPRFILSTVAFSKNQEEIRTALQIAYPPQVEEGFIPYEENIKTELKSLGLTPTGDLEQDLKNLEKARAERAKVTGKPDQIILEDGTSLPVLRKEDGFYDPKTDIKIANIDPDTDKPVPLTEAEEFEVDASPPTIGSRAVTEPMLLAICPGISNMAVDDFFATDGSRESITAWYKRNIITAVEHPWAAVGIDRLIKIHTRDVAPTIYAEAAFAWTAGWGDVLATTGAVGKWLGIDGFFESLTKKGNELQAMAMPDDLGDFNWKLLANPRFYALRGTRVVPFTLSLLPSALLGYWGGAAVAGATAVRLGLGVFGKTILTAIFGGIGGAAAARPLESAMEAGSAYDQAISMGATHEEADLIANEVFVNNLKLAGLDVVQIAAAFAPVPIKVGTSLIHRGLVRTAIVAGKMTIVGLSEAGEEAYQEVITRQALGQEVALDADMQQAMALGGMMGLGMGAGGEVLSGIINQTKDNMTPTQKEKFDADVVEVGEKEALDKFTETPEGAKLVEGVVEVVKEQQLNKEITDPKKRVNTKEVKFLEEQLTSVEREVAVIRKSHATQSGRLETLKEAKAPAYELTELQESIKNLEGMLSEFSIKKASIQSKLEALGRPVPEAVEPRVLEAEEVGLINLEEYEIGIEERLGRSFDFELRIGEKRFGKAVLSVAMDKPTLILHSVEVDVPATLSVRVLRGIDNELNRIASQIGADKIQINVREKDVLFYRRAGYTVDEANGVAFKRVISPVPAVKTEGLSEEELLAGKAINVKAAEAQTENLVGLPERTIDVGVLEQLRVAAQEYVDTQLFSADMSNPLSKAMVAASHLGSIPEYVKQLPSDIYENVSQEFKDAEFADSPRWNLNIQPVVDAVSVIDRGYFGGALRMKVFQVADQAQVALLNYQGGWSRRLIEMEKALELERPSWIQFKQKKAWNEMTATILENITFQDTIVESSELLKREEIAKAVEGLPEEQQLTLVEYGKNMRMSFDEVLAEVNSVRVKLGREPIEYLENYLPWVYRTNIWGRFLGIHLKPDFLAEQALAPDFIKPSAPFNARALARKGGLEGYEKVRDVRRLFLDYVGVASREMFYTPAITNTKAHARVLREKGLEVPASYVEDWAIRTMAGVPDPLTRWRQENIPPFLYNPLMAVRARLNPAVFGLNIPWNIFIQTSSIALSNLMTGTKNTILGAQYLWNPRARRWVQDNVPAYIIKQRGRGSLVHQDLGATLTEARKVGLSPLETVDGWVTVITRLIEREITGVTAYAAKVKGEKAGLRDDKLVAYASDGAAKTQSMYDPIHLPQAYSPGIRLLIPFQTFCFEALTRVREMTDIKWLPKAGAYETVAADSIEGKGLKRIRALRFLEFMAAMWVINMVGEAFNRRKPWELSSFIPASNVMMIGVDSYNPWNLPYPARYTRLLWAGFDALIEYGNWKPLIYWALMHHFPAGVQSKRMVEGTIAGIEGEHKDVAGEVMFELEPGEWLKSATLGVWSTESAEDYRKRVIEGEPEPTRLILEHLEDIEAQLGTDVEGKYYTLGKCGNEGLALIKKTGIPEWQILEGEPIYSPLLQFRLYCEIMWEEYSKIPTEHRIEYRRNNPYLDASLYFWEKVSTVRSEEAKEELEKLFRKFIEGNPRAHWRGLPEIPEHIKLLPE